jgi:hypothetical protein
VLVPSKKRPFSPRWQDTYLFARIEEINVKIGDLYILGNQKMAIFDHP